MTNEKVGRNRARFVAAEDLQSSPFNLGFVIQLHKGLHYFFEGN